MGTHTAIDGRQISYQESNEVWGCTRDSLDSEHTPQGRWPLKHFVSWFTANQTCRH